jgi:hypothetical protein
LIHMKKAYGYRGSIVHGETTPDISYEFLSKIRQYTRESLKTFLKNPTLRTTLDEFVLKGMF